MREIFFVCHVSSRWIREDVKERGSVQFDSEFFTIATFFFLGGGGLELCEKEKKKKKKKRLLKKTTK